jgi:formylmethanofuran dehydrogenase subunit D
MATTSDTHPGNGSNKLFSISFPYLETSDIDVYLNGTLQTITTHYTFANATTVEFVAAPANGAVILLDRNTDDSDNPATFFPGSSIKSSDLNHNFDQTLYVVQELGNQLSNKVNKLGDTMSGNLAMAGNKITGLGTTSNANDAATKQYVDDNALLYSGSPAFTQDGTGAVTRSWSSKLKDVVSVKDFGAVGDGVADDTAAINAAIAAHGHVYFPPGVYAVTTVNFNHPGTRCSGTPSFKGIATTATAAVIELTNRSITFESLAVDQNFNSNYTSAIKWHSPSAGQPAQYIKIKELFISNCIIGILFGQLFGTAVVNASQSENSITHMNTRGCQTPIYMRQPNGFLFISESTISSIRNEWEIFNPGVYSYADSRIIVNHVGHLYISNSEVIKTDTQAGLGLELLGGATNLSNVFTECASRLLDITLGDISIVNSLLYFSNANECYWRIAQAATGTAFVSNTTFLRAVGAANSSRGFIEHEGNTAYRLMGSNCRAVNFLNSAFIISAQSRPNLIPRYFDLQNFSCQDGDPARADIEIASNQTGRSLLTAKNVDLSGDTTDGWFNEVSYGGGSSFGVIADGPSLSPKDKTLANSLELNAPGEAYLRSIDVTSAATAKSTGLTVTPGQTLLVTCWLKRISGAQARVGLAAVTTGGTVSYLDLVSSATDLPVGTWTYLQTVCQVPAGVKYVGIEMRNTVSVSRLSGADLTILN